MEKAVGQGQGKVTEEVGPGAEGGSVPFTGWGKVTWLVAPVSPSLVTLITPVPEGTPLARPPRPPFSRWAWQFLQHTGWGEGEGPASFLLISFNSLKFERFYQVSRTPHRAIGSQRF